jgi:hypothetical protein
MGLTMGTADGAPRTIPSHLLDRSRSRESVQTDGLRRQKRKSGHLPDCSVTGQSYLAKLQFRGLAFVNASSLVLLSGTLVDLPSFSHRR